MDSKASESQFDGLARESTSIAYRCPAVAVSGCAGGTAQKVVSRQGTKAGAKVDNYNDPLTAGQTGWTQWYMILIPRSPMNARLP